MIKRIVYICAIVVFASTAFGQDNSTPRQLSLDDCIKIALERNTTVLQSQYQAESQDARVLSAYGGLLPSLNASGEFNYTDLHSPPGSYTVGTTVIQTNGISINRRYSAGVEANYTLFNGFANYATVNQASSASQAADLGFGRSKQTGAYQATVNYLAVFNARDQLKISQDNLTRDQQQLETIKEQNSVGSASLAQVYQQQSVVAADEYLLVQAKNTYDQAQASLKFFLGIPVTDNAVFADSTVKSDIDTTEFVQINRQFSETAAVIDKALQARSDYQAAVADLNASKSSLTIAEAAYSPVISASLQYGIYGPELANSGISQNKNLSGLLSVSLPIFNGFQTQSNIEEAGVAVKSSEQTLDAAQRQVALDVYQALLNLNASEKGYEAAVNSVASAKINLETAQEKFRIGGATLLDVLTANAQYTQALSNQVIAAYTYIQAKKQIEYAIGTINY
ncbi:MAG TPA: TolC family protein [Candidatus Acidoferrales bacterium]|nr:TolC family protein [Candidatus Acidoferrales bacterium]